MSAAIFEALRKDHETQRDLLARLAETSGDTPARRDLFAMLADELEAHATAEEKSLYAALMTVDGGQEVARHSVAEHKELSDLLDAVRETEFSSPAWLGKLAKLAERVHHHLDEEEHEVFQQAGRILTDGHKATLEPIFSNARAAEA